MEEMVRKHLLNKTVLVNLTKQMLEEIDNIDISTEIKLVLSYIVIY